MAASATTIEEFTAIDPLETLEVFARRADMDAQRIDETELHVNLNGSWRDVGIWFAWRTEAQVLQIGAPLEMRVPKARAAEVYKLLALVNERLWFGHFDLNVEEGGIVYRNSAVLPVGQSIDDCQAEILLRGAMDAFERFYPAFNFAIWGGMAAEEALDAAVSDTAGTA
ncbi:YbjN domain-containing protein [Parvularcula marina]|nr:YbjN domain-containing protein [Parvularcula marina]